MPAGARNTGSPRPARGGNGRRAAAVCAAALLPVLASCSPPGPGAPASDIGAAPREAVADGGALRWAVDQVPATFNVFQADATQESHRVAGAVLPALFTLDDRGRPRADPDYLESAALAGRGPRQVVVYRLNPRARWSGGRAVSAADFEAQWRALAGRDPAYLPARNEGYRQIEKVERGRSDQEVRVTFAEPYADWRSLFTPLYPRSATGTPAAFNKTSRTSLPETAGPFRIGEVQRAGGERSVTLMRDNTWWGQRAKLDCIILTAVPREERAAALDQGRVDLAELEPVPAVAPPAAAPASPSPAPPSASAASRAPSADPVAWAAAVPGLAVRRAPDAAFTQLTLNGHAGPLADERVRRAVARAIDRKAIARAVLEPLHLPGRPLGNHLLLAPQDGYQDNSSALGGHSRAQAEAMLADSGWHPQTPGAPASGAAGPLSHRMPGVVIPEPSASPPSSGEPSPGESGKAGKKNKKKSKKKHKKKAEKSSASPGSSATGASASPAARGDVNAPGRTVTVVEPAAARTKNGKRLVLRLVVPDRAPLLGAVADRVAAMLSGVGARTEITRVPADRFFTEHVSRGAFDLALFTWPGSAFPVTDARSIYAKPMPAPDGSLVVEQNYARVGTDEIDQLFEQAVGELDPAVSRRLAERADARIWATAHSLPLYQRPQLVAVRKNVANAGAFGFATPRYQDIGYLRPSAGQD